ncbi:MAG: SIS domain-containing protein [Actinomycetia bacterium]|nr:SIS domain-containing protein [Actinomycetes bacterium]
MPTLPYRDALVSQPDALLAAVARVRSQLPALAGALGSTRPVFLGIGASHCAAAVGVHLLQQRGVAASRCTPGQVGAGSPALGDLVVAVSQGGRSAEIVDLLQQWAPEPAIALVNVPGTPVCEAAGHALDTGDQPDSRASTSGFTATVAALALLAQSWTGGAVDAGWDSLGEVLGAFSERVLPVSEELATALAEARWLDCVGAGVSVGVAEEVALLAREVANIPAYGADIRTYLHGPMEATGDGAHLFFGTDREAAAAAMLAERGRRVVLITPVATAAVVAARDAGARVVATGVADEPSRAIVETILAQHVMSRLAQARGCQVDEFVFTQTDTKIDGALGSETGQPGA